MKYNQGFEKLIMELDEALEATRPLGLTQMLILLASVLMNIQSGFLVLNNVFLAKTPPHHCANHSGFSLEESVPFIDGSFSKCEEYSDPLNNSNETRACSSWYFETEDFGKSVVSDWNLVCYEDYLPRVGQSLMLAGFAVGSVLGGPVADKYGKKPTLLVSLVVMNILGLSVSVSQGFLTYGLLRFLIGSVFKAVRIPLMNLMFEFLIPKYRSVVGLIPFVMSSVGLMIMSGVAYLIRDWRYLNLTLMTPTLLIMCFAWILPESVRWSLSRGKVKDAEKIMQRIAKFNGAKNFTTVSFGDQNGDEMDSTSVRNDKSSRHKSFEGLRFVARLFQRPTLTVTIVLCWNWITITLVYFGFALTTGSLAGNMYLNFCLSSMVDIPSTLTSIFLIRIIGSLIPIISGLVLAVITMALLIILPLVIASETVLRVLVTVLSLTGRFSIGLTALPMFLLMSDLFPTPIRNTGTSFVQLIGNIGSLSAPLLVYMNKYFSNIAFIVMVVCTVLAAGLSFLLPDPQNTKQLATAEELEALFATRTIFKRWKKRNSSNAHTSESMEQKSASEEGTEMKGLDTGERNDVDKRES